MVMQTWQSLININYSVFCHILLIYMLTEKNIYSNTSQKNINSQLHASGSIMQLVFRCIQHLLDIYKPAL